MAVAGGYEHTVAVGEDGSIFSFGFNRYGELGLGDTGWVRPTPTRVTGLPGPVRQVSAGIYHTGIVTESGDLHMCGLGARGRNGLGDETDRTTPTLIPRAFFDDEAVLMVSCGDEHSVVVTESGGVYTFGQGSDGRLGHGNQTDQRVPRRVPETRFNGERVVMVAAGGAHTVALSEAGHVFTWGDNLRGQLGHGNELDRYEPLQVDTGRFGGERVVFVAAGIYHTAAVTAGGRLYTWGSGWFGQLGHGDTNNRLVPTVVGPGAFGGSAVMIAACGYLHTLVMTQDGALWACGRGDDGRLGLNGEEDRHVFERVGAGVFGGARVVAVEAGYNQSSAVTEDGALWTWGCNSGGQLGLGDMETRLEPTRIPQSSLSEMCIGRCGHLPEEHVLAFTMGTHARLGGESSAKTLAGESGLPLMIAKAGTRWVQGEAGEIESLVRLLGGVSLDRKQKYKENTTPGTV